MRHDPTVNGPVIEGTIKGDTATIMQVLPMGFDAAAHYLRHSVRQTCTLS